MSIPHLHRVDENLHQLGQYALDSARDILKIVSDTANAKVNLMEEDLAFFEERDARLNEATKAEFDRTIQPLLAQADQLAQRIDSVDAYARSISSLYRQERNGMLDLGDAWQAGYETELDPSNTVADVVGALQGCLASAESLRDQIAASARLPRLLQDEGPCRQLSQVIEQAKALYTGLRNPLFQREWNRVANQLQDSALGSAPQHASLDELEEEALRRERAIAQGAREGFAQILAPQEVDLLDELANLALDAAKTPAQETCDFLMLGWLAYQLPEGPFTPEFTDDTPLLLDIPAAYRALYGERLDGDYLIVPQLLDRSENCSCTFVGNRTNSLPLFGLIAAKELAGTRAGCQKFLVIDLSGAVVGLEDALPFIRTCPELLEAPVITDPQEALTALRQVLDRVMSGRYPAAVDMVEQTGGARGDHAPLLTVIAINMPSVVDESWAEALINIAQHGHHAGVNLLMNALPSDEGELRRGTYDLLASVPEENLLIDCSDGRPSVWWDAKLFYDEPDWSFLSAIQTALAHAEEKRAERYRGISTLVPEDRMGAGDPTSKLSIPFGFMPNGAPLALEFGDAVADGLSHFALATGTTGTGKTSLLHAIILSGLATYGPDDLALYLLDFKQGVEFEVYAKYRLPHMRVVALDADQAFGASVLEELYAELQRRAKLYQELGVTNYAAARRASATPLPRYLVVLDEFQVLLNESTDRRAANRAAAVLRTFFQTARAFGMHFILSTQTLASLNLGCSMSDRDLSQVNVRIALNNSEAEFVKLFGDRVAPEARQLLGREKGSGVYLVDKDAAEPDLKPFRFAYCDDDEKARVLTAVQERYANVPAKPAFVYRGLDVPRLSECAAFATASSPAPSAGAPGAPLRIYLGEPARMGQQVALEISRTRRSTLLATSVEADMVDRLQASYIAGAIAATPGAGTNVYVLDAHLTAGDGIRTATEAICRWAGGRVRVARTWTELVQTLDHLAGELKDRAMGASGAPTHFVVLGDHQLAEPLAAFVAGRDLGIWRQASGTPAAQEAHTSYQEPLPQEPRMADPAEPATATSDIPHLDTFEEMLAKINALNSEYADDTASAAAASALDAAPTGSSTESPAAAPQVLAGRSTFTDLLEYGHTRGIACALFNSDYLAIKDMQYETLPKMAWRVVHGLSDNQCHFIVPDVNPAALRDNTAIMWDGAHPPFAFKPYRVDPENLPPLPAQ